jgi:hypothetical protein
MHALTKLLRLLQSYLAAYSMARICSMKRFEASCIAIYRARPSQKIGFFLLNCRQGQESSHLNTEFVLCPFSRLKDYVQLYGIPFVLKIDLFGPKKRIDENSQRVKPLRPIKIRKVRICVGRDAHGHVGQCLHGRLRPRAWPQWWIDRLETSRRRGTAWPVRVSRPLTSVSRLCPMIAGMTESHGGGRFGGPASGPARNRTRPGPPAAADLAATALSRRTLAQVPRPTADRLHWPGATGSRGAATVTAA